MRILHICVTGPYTDGFNYQENMLTKYQVKAGHEVHVIASQWEWSKDGKIKKHNGNLEYVNSDGVSVTRLSIVGNRDIFYRYKRFVGFYNSIEKINPDIIFVHNLQFFDIREIVHYSKNHSVKIYADNHADFLNSARNKLAIIFYKIVWRHMAHMIEPYTTKFYGVLPARVDFLKDIYKVPIEKCELLVMGADDEEVCRAGKAENQKKVRDELKIALEDFLIVTGGKIDEQKSQTLVLMEAVKRIDNNKIKLLIFGPVSEGIKEEFDRNFDAFKMRYVSWANRQQSYDYFAIADLIVFPGKHSVYWEQAVGQGKPMICKYFKGINHVDIGGNVEFIDDDSVEHILSKINIIVQDPEKYTRMKDVATKKGMSIFSYKRIAECAIGR